MFEVRNKYNVTVRDRFGEYISENLDELKKKAERLKEATGSNFTIVEVKQVWTTSTLDEAIKSK